jgi:3-dehydroquinate dehydratase/shikimate dehydrogenase
MSLPRSARICVPVCARHADELRPAVVQAAAVADIIELRLDYLEAAECDQAVQSVPALLGAVSRPFILTFRPAEQGGRRALSLAERVSFWKGRAGAGDARLAPLWADLELDLANHLAALDKQLGVARDWSRIICSHHDFSGVPIDLDHVYERLAETPARILKIAVQASTITDCIPVLRVLERACREGRQMIAIAMGQPGIMTRLLAPARGAYLTFGSLDDAQASAPGQIRAADLRDLYRIQNLTARSHVMGVVGLPVGHSMSPRMHNAALAARGLDAIYIPFEVHDVGEFMRRMVDPRSREIDWNLRGLSVTAPHKSTILEHLSYIESTAREIGAVNTVVIDGDQSLGYNTDAIGALAPLIERIPLSDTNVAVIGAGGAARAVLWGLKKHGARLTIFARAPEKAQSLAQAFGARCAPLAGATFGGFDIVINTTPLGTSGPHVEETPSTAEQLQGARIAYDLVYNPAETRFLREARAAGCETVGGLAMLVAQAAEQFKLWTGLEAPVDLMREAAAQALIDSSKFKVQSSKTGGPKTSFEP